MAAGLADKLNEYLEHGDREGEQIAQSSAGLFEDREMRSVLSAGLAVRTAFATVSPRPEFQDDARIRFYAALDKWADRQRGVVFMWRRLLSGAVAAGLALALAGGTIGASASSLPGDTLYGVKQLTEQAQLSLAVTDASRAQLQLDQLARRLDEINRLLKQGRPVPAGVLEAVQRESDDLANHSQILSSEDLTEKVLETLQHQQELLNSILASAPDGAKPALEKALGKAIAGLERAEGQLRRELEDNGKDKGNKPNDDDDDTTSTPTSGDTDNDESNKVAEAIASFFGVSVQSVEDLKDDGLGFGEIFRLLQWSKDSGKTVQEILDMLDDTEGWGRIRRELGLDVPDANHPNLGNAKRPTPTATSTPAAAAPSGTPTSTATVTATRTPPGKSGEHRNDDRSNSEEHRKDGENR